MESREAAARLTSMNNESSADAKPWKRPSIESFRDSTEKFIAPHLTGIGFKVDRLIDGGSYYAYLFSRNNWGLLVYFEWRENYMDIRLASDTKLAAFGINLIDVVRKLGVNVVGLESTELMPTEKRVEWWSTQVLQPSLSFLAKRTGSPKKSIIETRH